MNEPDKCTSVSSPIATRNFRFAAGFAAALLALSLAAHADDVYYGTVESFDGGQLVLKTTKHSTGHWKVNGATHLEGSVQAGDWVFANVATSGHIATLRFEERPTAHAGVIQKIHNQVLTVHSGPNIETWNLKETTLLDGVTQSDLKAGDEIGVKLYKNHNLATLRVVKTGVPVK